MAEECEMVIECERALTESGAKFADAALTLVQGKENAQADWIARVLELSRCHCSMRQASLEPEDFYRRV